VVGGVGGAILLGGLALLAWRIWGRKKYTPPYEGDDDDMMSGDSSVMRQKRNSNPNLGGYGNQPFQNNLEQYHRPGPTNAASNFWA
jgi:hypothetical protein